MGARFHTILLGALLIATTACATARAARLTSLANEPDWNRLEAYQYTVTRAEFIRLVNEVYSPDGGFWKYCQLGDDHAVLFSDTLRQYPLATLRFAPDEYSLRPLPVDYAPAPRLLSTATKERPLEGAHICLDPGHIGGEWAKLEERFFQIAQDPPIEEAELNWITCQRLAEKLEALGARVSWSKPHNEPVTTLRPGDLRDVAIQSIATSGSWPLVFPEPAKILQQVDDRANSLFYRTAEIRARAEAVAKLKPDLTLCIHFNAAAWGDSKNPQLVDQSKLVYFINGAYSESELSYDDQKFELLIKLLDKTAPLEQRGAELVAGEMAARFKMPPETYANWNAVKKIGTVPGVFARNLLANRSFPGPVIFVEGPYMNARDAYSWLIAGDYDGLQTIDGRARQSLFREFADAIAAAVVRYYSRPSQ